jgi:hypothetical protein
MKYSAEMASCVMIYIPSLMKIGTGTEAILRVCLGNFTDSNVGISDVRDF